MRKNLRNSEFAFCGVFFFITAGHNQDRKGAESMNIQKIGKLIAACRKEKGMTQAQLAEKLGVTNKTVSQWENGNYMPDLTILEPLSHELGISLEELLSGERIILFCTTNLVFKNEKREKIILTSTHYNCSI